MVKQNKRMTRAEKVALSQVTSEYRTAADIGVDVNILGGLAARGYVVSVTIVGPDQYRITESGMDALSQILEK